MVRYEDWNRLCGASNNLAGPFSRLASHISAFWVQGFSYGSRCCPYQCIYLYLYFLIAFIFFPHSFMFFQPCYFISLYCEIVLSMHWIILLFPCGAHNSLFLQFGSANTSIIVDVWSSFWYIRLTWYTCSTLSVFDTLSQQAFLK